MIRPRDLFSINFYEKSPFYGSYQGMHYRIAKTEQEGERVLMATVWPGPYNFETTDDSQKKSALFPFSDEGLEDACSYLNRMHDQVCAAPRLL